MRPPFVASMESIIVYDRARTSVRPRSLKNDPGVQCGESDKCMMSGVWRVTRDATLHERAHDTITNPAAHGTPRYSPAAVAGLVLAYVGALEMTFCE